MGVEAGEVLRASWSGRCSCSQEPEAVLELCVWGLSGAPLQVLSSGSHSKSAKALRLYAGCGLRVPVWGFPYWGSAEFQGWLTLGEEGFTPPPLLVGR